MAYNHLEQLIAEWLEYSGFFVRRNVKVDKRSQGGYDGELDVIGFHPRTQRLVHYEASADTISWPERDEKFGRKFRAGRDNIEQLFEGLELPKNMEQFAVLLYASNANHKHVGGGRVVPVEELLTTIVADLGSKEIARAAVPEQFAVLRTLQLACEYRSTLFPAARAPLPKAHL
jgi:hypothetical protein